MPLQAENSHEGGGGMDALTNPVTDTTLTIVSFGEPDLDRLKELYAEAGISHRGLFMDDYNCDGERHVWRYTFAPELEEVAL